MIKKIALMVASVLLVTGCSSTPSDPADNLQNFQTTLKDAFYKSVDRIEATEYMYTREESLEIVRNTIVKDGASVSTVEIDLEFEKCPVSFEILSTLKDSPDLVPLYLLSGSDTPQATTAALSALAAEAENNKWIVQKDFLHFVTDVYEDTNVVTIALNSNGEIAYHSISISAEGFNETVDKVLKNDTASLKNISTVSYLYGDSMNSEKFSMGDTLNLKQDWWLENFSNLAEMNTFEYSVLSENEKVSSTPVITSEGTVLLAKESDGAFEFFTLENKKYEYEGKQLKCQAKV
jgi:PBP1b-binding outer membrane lipoprotein LpoB